MIDLYLLYNGWVRLITLLFSTLILVALMAWYLTKVFAPTTTSPVSTYDNAQQQLEEVQKKTDQYSNLLNKINR
jgi:hypothetical protein